MANPPVTDPTSVYYNFCDYYQTRRKAAIDNKPPPRIDSLALSPYPNFTQYQLDMRRKIEILRYNGNASNTKTNNFTRAEKWKQLVSRKLQARTYSNEYFNNVNAQNVVDISCNLVPTPSTACDIPGPLFYLQLDTNVPLYSYNNMSNNIGIIDEQTQKLWELTTYGDALSYASSIITIPSIINDRYNGNLYSSTILTSIYLQNNVKSSYTYSINTSIGLYAIFTKNGSTTNLNMDISMNIQDIIFQVKYAQSNVTLQKTPVITSVASLNSMNININNLLLPNTNVIASQYVGNLNISNLFLYTQPGYLYDLAITFKLGYNVPSNLYQYFKLFELKAIVNMTDATPISENCTIYNPSSTIGFSTFSLSGV
jgi:hypothetical protein